MKSAGLSSLLACFMVGLSLYAITRYSAGRGLFNNNNNNNNNNSDNNNKFY